MNRYVSVLIWGLLFLTVRIGYAQQSTNVVDYQVTYDQATDLYTAWVVPQYNTPNTNNTGANERGGTAQFTLKVPASFSITEIADVRGTWEKAPLRLGPGNPGQDWTGSGLDPTLNYYVIGKSPSETNYGPFVSGTPVALFTFRGNGCFGPISPLEPGNSFISQADQRFSLNVANSFYSVSGQPTGGNQNPLEQFRTVTGPAAQCSALQANPDNLTLTAGVSTTVSVLANDTRNGLPVSSTSVTVTVSTPNSGSATVNPDGTISYVPAAGFSGPVSFTYTICDLAQPSLCSSSSINLTINSNAVTLVATADQATTNTNTPLTLLVLTNDTRNGQPASIANVTVSVSTPPASGTATVNGDGSISFTPAAGFSGPISFTYTICDIAQPGQCASAPVSLTVNAAPVVLVATADQATTNAGTAVSLPVLTNDTRNGLPASTTSVTVTVSTPNSGSATVNPNGTISYVPAAGFSGPVSFTYTICDIAQPGQCASAVVSLTVNASLQASPDNQILTAGIPTTIPVLANDTRNGQPISNTSVTVTVSVPNAGTATVNPDGTVTYTPAAGFTGPISFTYTVCDNLQPTSCSSAPISLTVQPAANQPADLLITKQVSQSVATVGTSVSFTITVQNLGPGSAIGVTVLDTLARNGSALLLGTPTPSKGSYNTTTGVWTVGSLSASEIVTLVLTVQIQAQGVLINTASVTATGSQDPVASNNEASSCATVPIQLCTGDEFIVTVPDRYQGVQWFRNGSAYATGNSILITQVGTYSVTSTDGSCPLTGCCPIIVEEGNCCAPDKCVPFVIKKTKSRL
ncbi:Ig-like domain-containing protein [Spirosoma fluminis]